MSDERRFGRNPRRFSGEIRSVKGGGTIPDEWGCRVVDLDEFYAIVDGELLRVRTTAGLWGWYRDPVEVVALVEQKNWSDPQQSWDVTRALATQASVEGFRIVAQPDGTRRVTDMDLTTRSCDSSRSFVEQWIKPLIDRRPT